VNDYTADEGALVRAMGRQIAAERVAAKMSQATLAERVGITQKSLGRYERGERDIQLKTIGRIADALGLPPSQIMLAAEERAERDAGYAPDA
jgi:transcriptional regulator with XRE-family HTH domain